ncbi:MAG: 50S ribosomal protein L10 [Anaerolineae bacterium]|nr:50S ribosomal protein L10 [Anaerolineae bacterium]
MPLTRTQKQELITGYLENLRGSKAAILTDYRGLTVSDITRLRRQLREVGCTLQVTKNTLLALALREAGMPVPEDLLKGPVAVGFCAQEPTAATKILSDFAKETKILTIRGGLVGNQVLDSENVVALATLPPREVLLAQVLGSLQGPAGTLVGLLQAPLRQLAYVLQSRGEQSPQSA